MARVHAEVHQHLRDLRGIGKYCGDRLARTLPDDLDRAGKGRSKKPDCLVDDGNQRQRLTMLGFRAREQEDAAHHIACSARRGANSRNRVALLGPWCHVLRQQLRVSKDYRQQVVEVMRHAAGERSQRFRLLPPLQALFERMSLLGRGGRRFAHARHTAFRLIAAMRGARRPDADHERDERCDRQAERCRCVDPTQPRVVPHSIDRDADVGVYSVLCTRNRGKGPDPGSPR